MNDRNEKNLISLRPILTFEIKEAISDLEQFQNNVLRPIIKMQHEVIINVITAETNYQKLIKSKVDYDELLDITNTYNKKNTALRNLLIGSIIGMMTMKELHFYTNQKAFVNKRILSMIIKRIVDTQYEKVRIEY